MNQAIWAKLNSAKSSCRLSWFPFLAFTLILLFSIEVDVFSKPVQTAATATPTLEFTSVPPYGSSEDLRGRVRNLTNPNGYKIAVYIFIEGAGWWTKPRFDQSLVTILPDSTWNADITTGGSDINATRIRAFLLPQGVVPPISAGLGCLPDTLDTISKAQAFVERDSRTISFSGYEWWVKASFESVGPGPCIFSDSAENVWVDTLGQLHMKITNKGGIWSCSEVILKNTFGYGKYVFKLASDVGQINENAVLGLFTWDNDACAEFSREVDIEFSRFGNVAELNAQYVIQPYYEPGNLFKWQFPASLKLSTHVFEWTPDSIDFKSGRGHEFPVRRDSLFKSWVYKKTDLPTPGKAHARINLWLFNGRPPSDLKELEVVINRFEYHALPTSVDRHEETKITRYALLQNYPNPFNPSTTIRFEVPKPSRVSIKIYDLQGREIRTLVEEKFNAGQFARVWDGRNNDKQPVASGVYLIKMQASGFVNVKKLVLVR